jgi:hypothetical protein
MKTEEFERQRLATMEEFERQKVPQKSKAR